MNILITGARAPVAIEWARIALRSGHRVWLADSLRWPLGRFLQGIEGYLRLPSPRQDLAGYQQQLQGYLDQHAIGLLIPTCEEIFYLSQAFATYIGPTEWLIPERRLLFELHHKYQSLSLLTGLGEVRTPATRMLTSCSQITDDPQTILKPVYSRFGRRVIRTPNPGVLNDRQLNEHIPWVQQQKLEGVALCNYAVFEHGRLIAHQAYQPKYCFNQAAGSYFVPHQDRRLDDFVRQFGEKTGFHGQVAFDFIEQDGVIFVIECNPRATSGLHLLGAQMSIAADGQLQYQPAPPKAGHVGVIILLFFTWQAWRDKQLVTLWRDFRQAPNLLNDHRWPISVGAQWCALLEMGYRSLRYRRPLTDASTFDIEWDG